MADPTSGKTNKDETAIAVRWLDPYLLQNNFPYLNGKSALEAAMNNFEHAGEDIKYGHYEESDIYIKESLHLINKVLRTNKDGEELLKETLTDFMTDHLNDAYTWEKDQQALDCLMHMMNEAQKENQEEITLNNAEPRWLNQSGTYKTEAAKRAHERIAAIGKEKLNFLSLIGLLHDASLNLDAELENG